MADSPLSIETQTSLEIEGGHLIASQETIRFGSMRQEFEAIMQVCFGSCAVIFGADPITIMMIARFSFPQDSSDDLFHEGATPEGVQPRLRSLDVKE